MLIGKCKRILFVVQYLAKEKALVALFIQKRKIIVL